MRRFLRAHPSGKLQNSKKALHEAPTPLLLLLLLLLLRCAALVQASSSARRLCRDRRETRARSVLAQSRACSDRPQMGSPAPVVLAAAAAAVLLLVMVMGAEAVWLDLPPTGTKCVSEEIQPNVVVLADYAVMYESHPTSHPSVAVKVTSPYGNTVHHNENATTGQFAFTTSEAGNYLACFWLDSPEKGSGISLNLDWKIGIAAKDWDSVAKKEKLEGVELELKKLEAAVESIHHNLLYLKAREAEMRVVSEKTNARVAWFSILSLGVCIVVSVLQLWNLQGFFRKKKLI